VGNIWLVGAPSDVTDRLFVKLSMNFPVRRIASITSVLRLLRMEGAESKPDMIIIDALDRLENRMALYGYLKVVEEIMPKKSILINDAEAGSQRDYQWTMIDCFDLLQWDDIELCQLMRQKISESRDSHKSVRSGAVAEIALGDLRVDSLTGDLYIDGNRVECLSPKEQALLKILTSRQGEIVDRTTLIQQVWRQVSVSHRVLDSHMSRLRKKVSLSHEFQIESVYGQGYALKYQKDL
jgi:hypothetical protein